MQRYIKLDNRGTTHILSDMVIIPENKESGNPERIYLAGTPEYVAYAEQNGFALAERCG